MSGPRRQSIALELEAIELERRSALLEALKIGGERSRNVVVGIVGGEENYKAIVEPMIAAGEIVMHRGRGGRIRLPRARRA